MTELVYDFFFQSFPEKDGVALEPVKLIGEPEGGNHSRTAGELRFTEDECEYGNKKIDIDKTEDFLTVAYGRCEDVRDQCGGIVLFAGTVECPVDVQLTSGHFNR